ncbi:hypothetical protein [Arcticibacterium luteifluviistationis]|uniref:Uncharacterized protein n=1 Tax=Arcticibacterium luteifluviistationis TaxID=1784714 RepID=A0A2Z4GEK6_9BACT|nr:hypothetical protein [Arcticibacterium luteifluviistationis]AWV99759.1 hypothetical protein DJ013_16895 [Arcticibacterium luteifluviistationis]
MEIMAYSFGLGVFGFLLVMFSKALEYRHSWLTKTGGIMIAQLVIVAVFLILRQNSIEKNARDKLLSSLRDKESLIISLNPSFDSLRTNNLREALLRLRKPNPHNSSPTNMFDVEVSSKGKTLIISIGRDSYNKDEYWVFQKSGLTEEFEGDIGRFFSTYDFP